ncbi:MAG: radical SAM protein [Proteobacteria bacterium]|nr:radical SAM protein [Pseudomonadota bacterium]
MNAVLPGLRIAIVTRGDLYPTNHGAAVKIVRTAEYLSLLGASVFVVTDDKDHYLAYEDGRVREVPYGRRFRAAQEWPVLGRWPALAERVAARVGYPSEELFMYRPQFDPQWWSRVLYVGAKEQIDVFQAEFPGYGLPCWLAAKTFDARCSIVQHNVEWDRLEDVTGLSGSELRRVRDLELFALRRADEVIAVSLDDRVRMVEAGIDDDKITVLPHGVDTLSYQADRGRMLRYGLGFSPETPLLFFHGTLHYWPNTQAVQFIAEELLPRLEKQVPDVQCVIAGLSPPTYYAHPRITFTGPVDDLPRWIQAADVCLCPVPSGGGTRMKLLEYFAAGKACVSMTKGAEGIRYTAGHELAIADEPQAFSDAVAGLLRDPAERARMGRAAREFVGFYDWTPIARRYIDLYRGTGRGGDYNDEVVTARSGGRAPESAVALPHDVDAIEAHLPVREPSKPRTLLLLVNRGCNLRCSFCDLWDDPQSMPIERAIALLDEAVAIETKTLVITGGEPFMYKPLFQLVRAAKERGLSVNITTNGTLIEKRWDELVDSGVDSLSVSLDGLKETHERIRGQDGCHTRTWKGIRKLRADSGIGLSVYFVVTSENIDELLPVYEQAREIEAGFDFWPVNDAEDLYLESEADRAKYEAAVDHIARDVAHVRERALFDKEGLAYHQGGVGRVRCLGLVDQYGVTYEGDLLPCCVWGGEDLRVGNVFETPLSELWTSERVQSFRTGMHAEGCTTGCFNHSLYEYTRSTGESFRVD